MSKFVKAVSEVPDGGTHKMVKGGIYETTDWNADTLIKNGFVVEITKDEYVAHIKKLEGLETKTKVATREKRVLDS